MLSPEQAPETLRRQRAELLELLQVRPPFSMLSGQALSDLVEACDVLGVPGGTYLVRAGQEMESLYGVLNGALRLVRRSDDGHERTVRELYRGEMLGLLGLFLAEPVPVDLLVVRDSTLVRLPRDRFLALVQKEPKLLHAIAHLMSTHLLDLLGALTDAQPSSSLPRGGTLALVALSLDGSTRETVRGLVDLMTATRTAAHVTADRVDDALGPGAAAGRDDGGRVTEWLSNLERGTTVVVYESGPRQPTWTARCVRQADRLVLVAASGDTAQIDDMAARVARATAGGVSRQIHLVLVHPEGKQLPSGTILWSRLSGVARIHHVRRGWRRDLERVVRHVIGRPVGLALSGGGARGIAHLGVLAAIVEADIPVDYVCGTSMGAIFAAGAAHGWTIERMRESVRDVFGPPLALYDLTLPVSSLLAGKKLDRVMRTLYGEADIEDLWLPFFCVSTDLSRAALVVHERGRVWSSVRASCSIPGMFPPQRVGDRALVDGGLMDNLPLDLLAERCPGPLIAVDVFPYGDPTFARPAGAIPRWLRNVRSRIKGEPASPPLFDILVRSTLVGSRFRQDAAAARLNDVVYLEPPVASFGLLGWRSHDALFDAGYRYAKDRLRSSTLRRIDHAATL